MQNSFAEFNQGVLTIVERKKRMYLEAQQSREFGKIQNVMWMAMCLEVEFAERNTIQHEEQSIRTIIPLHWLHMIQIILEPEKDDWNCLQFEFFQGVLMIVETKKRQHLIAQESSSYANLSRDDGRQESVECFNRSSWCWHGHF
jgi:hypothetical protein